MENDDNIPVLELKGEFLDEKFAARLMGKTVPEIREMVKNGSLKGKEWAEGDVTVSAEGAYLTPKTMAEILFVKEEDVLEWINSGKVKAAQKDGNYKIPYKEYSKFGHSGGWMPKMHDSIFEKFVQELNGGKILGSVNEGFKRGMKPHIDKAREVIDYLEKVHGEYLPKLNVLEDKTALVAAYVIHARIISLLHTTINLIENNELVGASTLFRSIYEGVDLSQYFILSQDDKNAQKRLRKWFDGGDVSNTTRTEFLVRFLKKTGIADPKNFKKQKDKMYDIFSGFVHFNFESIMESYNALSSDGFGQKKIHHIGFDYKGARLVRKSVGFLAAFEGTLTSELTTFLICFANTLPLRDEQKEMLVKYKEYFVKDLVERKAILSREAEPS